MRTESKTLKTVDIIAISDYHGEIEAPNEYPIASALYNLIKKIKDNNPDGCLVLGVGDMYDNPPLVKELKGVPARKVLERIGMEASAIGNHEFLRNIDSINTITMKDSRFPFLCVNVLDKKTDELMYQPYKIFDKGGVRIAVIGAAGPTVTSVIQKKCPEKYYTIDGPSEVNKYAAQIRAEKKADLIIVLVHEGGRETDGEAKGGLINFGKGLTGIDALYGGHSHSIINTTVDGLHILNAGARSRGIIHTRISTAKDGTPPEANSEYIPVCDLESDPDLVELDPEIAEIIKQANKDTEYKYCEVLGFTDKTITKSQWVVPYGESDIGNWVCDVMRERLGADIAIHSNKFLTEITKGKITVGGLFYVSKKCNAATMKIKLNELKEILENAVRDEDKEKGIAKGEGIQVSGLKFKYDMNMPSMNRIVDITKEDGTPVDSNKTMLVALNGRMVTEAYFGAVDFNNPEYELKKLKVAVVELLAQNLRENGGTVNVVRNKRIENINGGDVSEDCIRVTEDDEDDDE